MNTGWTTVLLRVRVQKIEAIRDLDGKLGKRIELIEEHVVPRFVIKPRTEEAQMVQETIQLLQRQLPFLTKQTQLTTPKIILFLTEQEYEELGIDFEVNQIYEITLLNQAIKFKKAV